MQIIECIPNFSEGRDKKTINAILQSIKSVKNIKVLHHTSDPDHNRSVITFIGAPEKVIEAAFNATKKAAELIDLTKQTGAHPRIGATDVIPLVPLKGISFEDLIPYAKKLGERIGKELEIPVHLYEKAATHKENENLANIRNPHHKTPPDFGPQNPGQAGSTAIGVRDFLIAFNINLKTKDIKIAKQIVKKIRESSGGLPNIKAIGLKLKKQNLVQVSINLTNYRITSPKKVFEEVKKEAAKLNTEILESELIGLIPEEALKETSPEKLMIKGFSPCQILKNK